jgi:excisionase family DNA binding protein
MSPQLLTVSAAAQALGLDRKTVAKAVALGQLDAVLVGNRWYVPAETIRRMLGTPPVTPIESRPRVRFR